MKVGGPLDDVLSINHQVQETEDQMKSEQKDDFARPNTAGIALRQILCHNSPALRTMNVARCDFIPASN